MSVARLAASRLDWAASQLADCRLCPRDCRVERSAGKTGWCGAGADARYFMEFVHYGEEAELVPSHTLYLTGCNLRCLFCHTGIERKEREAEPLTPERLKAIAERGQREGARNLNLLGGEPVVNLPALLRLLAAAGNLPPLVWNTNLYCTAEALEMVAGLPTVYLVDLKFGNDECPEKVSDAQDYWEVVRARLRELWSRESNKLIVRHLVLPGHLDCCTRPALEWLAGELGRVQVSLKTGYLVMPAAREDAQLGRFLTDDEARKAEALARSLDIELVRHVEPQAIGNLLAAREPHPRPAARETERPVEAELVISPDGAVFLHHPTREVTALALAATGRGNGQGDPA